MGQPEDNDSKYFISYWEQPQWQWCQFAAQLNDELADVLVCHRNVHSIWYCDVDKDRTGRVISVRHSSVFTVEELIGFGHILNPLPDSQGLKPKSGSENHLILSIRKFVNDNCRSEKNYYIVKLSNENAQNHKRCSNDALPVLPQDPISRS